MDEEERRKFEDSIKPAVACIGKSIGTTLRRLRRRRSKWPNCAPADVAEEQMVHLDKCTENKGKFLESCWEIAPNMPPTKDFKFLAEDQADLKEPLFVPEMPCVPGPQKHRMKMKGAKANKRVPRIDTNPFTDWPGPANIVVWLPGPDGCNIDSGNEASDEMPRDGIIKPPGWDYIASM